MDATRMFKCTGFGFVHTVKRYHQPSSTIKQVEATTTGISVEAQDKNISDANLWRENDSL
jgi:hypothetical protein